MRMIWTASLLAMALTGATGAVAADLSAEAASSVLAATPLSQWRGGGDNDRGNRGGSWNGRDGRADNDRGGWNRGNDRGRDNDRWNGDRRGNGWRDNDRRNDGWRDNDRRDRDRWDRDDRRNGSDLYRQRGGYYGGGYYGGGYYGGGYGNGGYYYGVPRARDPRENRVWDNGWRRDNRYDWSDYRRQNRDLYRIGSYANPYGNRSYSRFRIGLRIGQPYYNTRYWIGDPWRYRLPPVYGSYRWVRYYDDVLLIDTRTGYVQDAIYGFFW